MLRYRVVVYRPKVPEDAIRHIWPVPLAYLFVAFSDLGYGDAGQGTVKPVGQIVFQPVLEIDDGAGRAASVSHTAHVVLRRPAQSQCGCRHGSKLSRMTHEGLINFLSQIILEMEIGLFTEAELEMEEMMHEHDLEEKDQKIERLTQEVETLKAKLAKK